MLPSVEAWFATHTWQQPSWTVEELVALKRGRTVSVGGSLVSAGAESSARTAIEKECMP